MMRCGWPLALALTATSGCVVDRNAGSLSGIEPGTSTSSLETSGSSETTADADVDTSDSDETAMSGFDIPTETCASVGQTSTVEEGPSDILIVVDQSILRSHLESTFENFSALIGNDDIEDVRVVMLAGYPEGEGGVCINDAPLGLSQCPAEDHNPPAYVHVDEPIERSTALTQVLDSHPLWGPSMRPGAWKHVWIVSAGDPSMATDAFVLQLQMLDPGFDRLTVHAMVPGASADQCGEVATRPPQDAPELQMLATETAGVVESLCDYNVKVLFDSMLDRIHEVSLSCEYGIPAPPSGFVFDKGRVNVDYDDGFGLQTIGFVESVADCAGTSNGWYYDDAASPTQILMCPQTCGRFDLLEEASIEIRFGCTTVPAG